MERNGYTTITKEIVGLDLNKIWVYSILKSFRKKDGFSDLTFEQIEQYSGVTNVKRIIPEIKDLFAKIKQVNLSGNKKRNIYFFKEEDSFIYIDNKFLTFNDKKEIKVKAFIILLKCLCISGTNLCKFSKSEIANKTGLSRPTINKYINEAIKSNLLKVVEDGLLITNSFIIPDYIKEDNVYERTYHYLYNLAIENDSLLIDKDKKSLGIIIANYPEICLLKSALSERISNLPKNISCNYFCKLLCNTVNIKIEKTNFKIAL